jgi:hypothetical protein
MKSAYICGPLTELPHEQQAEIKFFYEKIADLFQKATGVRAFVPHEHYDPVKNADFTPKQVDAAERKQVCENSSLLVVVAVAPSWGGGIEVEMANQSGIPVLILCHQEKLRARSLSRLLLGNPAVISVIAYSFVEDAIEKLAARLRAMDIGRVGA